MDQLYFVSKRDWWIGAIMLLPMAIGFAAGLQSGDPSAIIILVAAAALELWIWYGTGYTIRDDGTLLITCGPVRGTVIIGRIQTVETSHAPWSSAALSLDRLKIVTSQGLWNRIWYVSPEDKGGFAQELAKRNPSIKVIL